MAEKMMSNSTISKAVFFDRDNTLIADSGYFHDPEKIVFLPGIIDGLKELSRNNFLLFIVTNQSGIGRGIFKKKDAEMVHRKLLFLLEEAGAPFVDIYYCPHAPNDHCECRKPKPFLVNAAIQKHHIDPSKSFFVGDRDVDVLTGKSADLKTILIAPSPQKNNVASPDFTAHDFKAAINWILKP